MSACSATRRSTVVRSELIICVLKVVCGVSWDDQLVEPTLTVSFGALRAAQELLPKISPAFPLKVMNIDLHPHLLFRPSVCSISSGEGSILPVPPLLQSTTCNEKHTLNSHIPPVGNYSDHKFLDSMPRRDSLRWGTWKRSARLSIA